MPARHDSPRWTWQRIARNIGGALLILAGLVLLVLPGPGLPLLAAGLLMIDFPGKRRLLRWLMSKPPVRRALNWVRRRFGKSALPRAAS